MSRRALAVWATGRSGRWQEDWRVLVWLLLLAARPRLGKRWLLAYSYGMGWRRFARAEARRPGAALEGLAWIGALLAAIALLLG